jgi:hypothetical protein
MFRYRFTTKNIERAKSFLKDGKGSQPSFLKKYKGSVQKGQLYLDNKRVVPPADVDKILRQKVLSGKVPMTRDGLYYFLSKTWAGITRAKIDKFLKSQRYIRKTDRMQPTSKTKKRRVKRKGQIGFDLIEINWKDLGFKPKEVKAFEKKLKRDPDYDPRDPQNKKKIKVPITAAYIWSSVDKITGLMWCKFAVTKQQKIITPIAKQAFEYFSKNFKIPMNRLIGFSDHGNEFDFKQYNKWGVKTVQLARESLIEKKNSQFQAALYRIAKMNISLNIAELIKRALQIVNRTKSKLLKVAPFEAIDVAEGDLSEKYNKKRGKGSGIIVKGRVLKVGDMVRLNLIGPKKTSFYKAYKGLQYSTKRYKVLAKKGIRYKIDGPKGKRFYHRDDLRLTSVADLKSDLVLRKRAKGLK